MATFSTRLVLRFAALVLAVLATGCASALHKASQRFADNLSTAILSEDDPGTVRDGVPAYLLLIDGLSGSALRTWWISPIVGDTTPTSPGLMWISSPWRSGLPSTRR